MTTEYKNQNFTIRFFNTLTREKEVFEPAEAGQVRIYTCGPTVYNYAHIGNFRTYVFEDLLRRTLKFFGYDVTQVMNLTDVDDKTIKGALAEGVSLNDFTQKYKDAFFEDMATLKVQRAEHYPAATDYIEPMIKMIQELMDKGFAYQAKDGSVYYKISQFPNYGCLSHLKMDELQAGASDRVANDEYDKDHVADFVLWKGWDEERDGQIYWDSPFGRGRPGWHIECSAMAMNILGESIDMHMGGVDNMFPHHENEIAQSEACSGKAFVRYWLHAEHLIVDGKKMSKSLGNFYTLRDLLDKGYSGVEVRCMLLQTHYKTQLNFTFEELAAVRSALHRINAFVQRMREVNRPDGMGKVENAICWAHERFADALADDLNISAAFAAVFDFIREINSMDDKGEISEEEAEAVLRLMHRFDSVLGVVDFEGPKVEIPEEILQAMRDREQARKDKDWGRADELRDFISKHGFTIEDTAKGPRVVKA